MPPQPILSPELLAFVAQLANFALSLLIWLIVGRGALRLIAGERNDFFSTFFRRFTEPAFRLVRWVTFGAVPERLVPWLTLLVVLGLRFALLPLLRPAT